MGKEVNGAVKADRTGTTIHSISITIDADRLYASNLEIAETILHEAFHAYIFGKLYGINSGGIIPEADFNSDFEAYRIKYGSEQQHNYMADMYRTFMINGLKAFINQSSEYGTFDAFASANYTGYHGMYDIFSSMAWEGLKNTSAWTFFQSNPVDLANYTFCMGSIVLLLPKKECNAN